MNVFYVAICSILELLKKFIEAVNKIASIDCFNRLLCETETRWRIYFSKLYSSFTQSYIIKYLIF